MSPGSQCQEQQNVGEEVHEVSLKRPDTWKKGACAERGSWEREVHKALEVGVPFKRISTTHLFKWLKSKKLTMPMTGC